MNTPLLILEGFSGTKSILFQILFKLETEQNYQAHFSEMELDYFQDIAFKYQPNRQTCFKRRKSAR